MPASTHDRIIRKVVSASATKGAAPGTHVFTLSTKDLDRDMDRIDPQGWDLSAFKANPSVLWGHDHKGLPIGRCPDIRVVGGQLKGVIEWPPSGIYPFADTCKGLVDNGFLRSASVGFIANEQQPNEYGGKNISRATLLEWSIVNIPSNPSAVLERGVDAVRLKHWFGKNWHEPQSKEAHMYLSGTTLEHTVARQLAALFEGQIEDDVYTKTTTEEAFDQMLAQLCQAWPLMGTEMSQEELGARVDASFRTLGPNASIADLCRALMTQGVGAAPKHWRGGDELVEFDDAMLATCIGNVIAQEVGAQTQAAFNHALGRLD